jgi:alanyl-tRNA synthetase
VGVDEAGFQAAMNRQREQARAASKFKAGATLSYDGETTRFVGYEQLTHAATVCAIYVEGVSAEQALEGQSVVVVLDTTPFYAESGGQVGDAGRLVSSNGQVRVDDCLKISPDVFGHYGTVALGSLRVGDSLEAEVDLARRARIVRHHSATHLMHKALRETLGGHVQQKGSLVDDEKTRFDFSHTQPMTAEEIARVEAKVNEEIFANRATQAQVMTFDEAVKGGATALFGEKYGDEVRVLDIGSSRELCGGTHVSRTGDIGLFKIVSESGVAAGIRRVEAVCGDRVLARLQSLESQVQEASALLKTAPAELTARLAQALEASRQGERELARLKSKLALSAGQDLASQAKQVAGITLLAARVEGTDAGGLREMLDSLKGQLKSAAIVLASVEGEKVSLIAGVTADLTARLKAGELVTHVAGQIGGKGGGRPDMAQGGGTQPEALPSALQSLEAYVQGKCAS